MMPLLRPHGCHGPPGIPLVTFLRHFPRTDDTTLIILKGHLLLEEEINNLLQEMLPNPQALDGLQINFFIKTQFARALIKNEALDDLLGRGGEAEPAAQPAGAQPGAGSGVEAAIRDFVTGADGRILGGEAAPDQLLKRRIAYLCAASCCASAPSTAPRCQMVSAARVGRGEQRRPGVAVAAGRATPWNWRNGGARADATRRRVERGRAGVDRLRQDRRAKTALEAQEAERNALAVGLLAAEDRSIRRPGRTAGRPRRKLNPVLPRAPPPRDSWVNADRHLSRTWSAHGATSASTAWSAPWPSARLPAVERRWQPFQLNPGHAGATAWIARPPPAKFGNLRARRAQSSGGGRPRPPRWRRAGAAPRPHPPHALTRSTAHRLVAPGRRREAARPTWREALYRAYFAKACDIGDRTIPGRHRRGARPRRRRVRSPTSPARPAPPRPRQPTARPAAWASGRPLLRLQPQLRPLRRPRTAGLPAPARPRAARTTSPAAAR